MIRSLRSGLGLGAVMLLALGHVAPAYALDPQSAQAYCNSVKQAALDAQQAYVKTYTPLQDPQQTFEDATKSCMSSINDIDINIPSMSAWMSALNGVLKKMEQQLIEQACNAAKQQFQNAVNNAENSINQVTQPTGLGVSTSGGTINVGTTGNNPIGTVVNQVGNSVGGKVTGAINGVGGN
ncbi:MAG: hypothetical protein EPN79_15810 [Burkholderiaceae bacterium]|nr:MAG: hypothetical protein EPN79_15810 [Burkholderiaceae bacterium]